MGTGRQHPTRGRVNSSLKRPLPLTLRAMGDLPALVVQDLKTSSGRQAAAGTLFQRAVKLIVLAACVSGLTAAVPCVAATFAYPGLLMNPRRMVSSCCSLSFNPKPKAQAFRTIRMLAKAKRARLRLAVKRSTTASKLLMNSPAYEGFSYPTSPLGSQGKGTGWDGNWAGSAELSGSSPITLNTSAGGYVAVGPSRGVCFGWRKLLAPISLDSPRVIFVSFLARADKSPSDDFVGGVSFYRGTKEAIFFGAVTDSDGGHPFRITLVDNRGRYHRHDAGKCVPDTTYFCVGKVLIGGEAEEAKLKVYAADEPVPKSDNTLRPADWTVVSGRINVEGTADRIRLAAGKGFRLDEIRIGTRWQDVTSPAPSDEMLSAFQGPVEDPGPARSAPLDAPGQVVNSDSSTNDSKPSLALLADGTALMAWHAYSPGHDRICVRQLASDGLGPIEQLSGQGTIHDAPLLVAAENDSAWSFWSTMAEGRWRLIGRRLTRGTWQARVRLSDPQSDALRPAAAHLGEGRVLLAWSAREGRRFRICSRILDGGVQQAIIPLSADEHDSYRPVVTAQEDGHVWVFWDSYREGNYAIRGRQVLPEMGPIEQISPVGENCLLPAALDTDGGLAVAWVRSLDVANDAGAVGQIHTLHATLRRDSTWRPVRDTEDDSTAATLVHGLTARMEPKPAAKLGHMARLRRPMLLEEGRGIWLLWERKTHHSAHPAHSVADLAARPCEAGRWGTTVILHSGLLDYRLCTDQRTAEGRFVFLASQLPRGQRRIYRKYLGDLQVHKPFQQDPWTGYRPVKLPLPAEEKRRFEISAGGKTYRLYWVDLHNHSGLTCDAHGEPDELYHYGRDRARIDAMALTDNDEVFDDPLTEAEYALGAFFARCFTEKGKFVGLPGYEWTSHVPNSEDVDRADPRCWDFRWFPGRCHSNHRTVIYPASGGPILRHTEIGNNIEKMFDTVQQHGGVVFPHHGSWDITGHPVEVGAEVTSAWHICFNARLLHRVLDDGHRMGFAGNSDSHRRHPGLGGALTAVYAEDLTAEDILEALRARRFYATNGSRIVIDSRANGALLGQQVEAASGMVTIDLQVSGTRPIVSATLVGDGKTLKTFPGTGQREFRAVYHSEALPKGTHWFYWQVAQEGESPQFPGNVCVARGHLAWCSPHWVVVP